MDNRGISGLPSESGLGILFVVGLVLWGAYAGVGWLWKKINPPPPVEVVIADEKGYADSGYKMEIIYGDGSFDVASLDLRVIDSGHISVRMKPDPRSDKTFSTVPFTIPVGTIFVAGPGGGCDLISADNSKFNEQVTLSVYCLDRWLPAPSSVQQILSPSSSSNSGSEERRRVVGLVECLAQHNGSHGANQIAVWMVSNDLMNYSEDQLVQETLDHSQQEFIQMQGAQLADMLTRSFGDQPSEILQRAKAKSEEDLLQMYQALRPTLEQKVRDQIVQWRTEAGPLLDACGYNSSSLPFFKIQGFSSFHGWDHAACQWSEMICAARDIEGEVGQSTDVDGPRASCEPDPHWSMDHHIDSGPLPPGLDFDNSHIIGTPTEVGDWLVTLAGDNIKCNGRSYKSFKQELRFHIKPGSGA
jgi:hypothetical protein